MLIKSSYTNSQIYSSRNIFPNDLPVYTLGLTDRSSASSADPADVELVSQQFLYLWDYNERMIDEHYHASIECDGVMQ